MLCIVRRISEYVTLLSWFKMYTDPEHADRRDLNIALKSLGEMDRLIAEVDNHSIYRDMTHICDTNTHDKPKICPCFIIDNTPVDRSIDCKVFQKLFR